MHPSGQKPALRERDAELYRRAAVEVLRAIRGKRSQIAFARRLGYRSNPITDWEHGRRHPTVNEVLRAAQLSRLPVRQAFANFHPSTPPDDADGKWAIDEWLRGLRGRTSIVELAQRVNRSRYSVSRWLAGHTTPKLHEFLELVDALTGRAPDWVAELVPIAQVPSLQTIHRQTEAAKTLAFELPWTEAILRVLETTAYQTHPDLTHEALAAWLGIDVAEFDVALRGLLDAGVIRREGPGYRVVSTLSVDTRVAPQGMRQLRTHWLRLALERAERGERDWFAYNLLSVSRADLQLIQERLRQAFRETRGIVAASEPSECAALVLMQLVHFEEPKT